jgi:hypothetical protein
VHQPRLPTRVLPPLIATPSANFSTPTVIITTPQLQRLPPVSLLLPEADPPAWRVYERAVPAAAAAQAVRVHTLPKVLRVFFRHDRRLHGEISRLAYGLVRDFTTAAVVVVFQSSGQFARWNPHWHGLLLEGGLDRDGRFDHLPTVDLARMSACFRQRVIAFFLERKLLNERLAKNMVEWAHPGFSVDGSIRIPWSAAAP